MNKKKPGLNGVNPLSDEFSGLAGIPGDLAGIVSPSDATFGSAITVYTFHGHSPNGKMIDEVINKAMKNGWSTLYAWKPDGETPDMNMVMALQKRIIERGLEDELRASADHKEYEAAGTLKESVEATEKSGSFFEKDKIAPGFFD